MRRLRGWLQITNSAKAITMMMIIPVGSNPPSSDSVQQTLPMLRRVLHKQPKFPSLRRVGERSLGKLIVGESVMKIELGGVLTIKQLFGMTGCRAKLHREEVSLV